MFINKIYKNNIGHCANMSELYLCHHKADGMTIDAEQDNMKLNGFFECVGKYKKKSLKAY